MFHVFCMYSGGSAAASEWRERPKGCQFEARKRRWLLQVFGGLEGMWWKQRWKETVAVAGCWWPGRDVVEARVEGDGG